MIAKKSANIGANLTASSLLQRPVDGLISCETSNAEVQDANTPNANHSWSALADMAMVASGSGEAA